ncbi:MAG: hypothetical protein ACF8OB_04955 [Phycisphaeraceae bacterium JB051]
MRRIIFVLAILCSTAIATAQDNELEQLKQEVAELRQLVAQLTERVDELEDNKAKSTTTTTTEKKATTATSLRSYQDLPINVTRIIPKRRSIQQHSFTLNKVTAKQYRYDGTIYLTFHIGVQNYSNSSWTPSSDNYMLRLKDSDIKRNGTSYGSSIKKGERKSLEITFKLDKLEPQEMRLVIDSKDKDNPGQAEFKINIQ